MQIFRYDAEEPQVYEGPWNIRISRYSSYIARLVFVDEAEDEIPVPASAKLIDTETGEETGPIDNAFLIFSHAPLDQLIQIDGKTVFTFKAFRAVEVIVA